MGTCNQVLDPDIVRWGLHFLDICSLSNSGPSDTVTYYAGESGPVGHVREGYCENCDSDGSVENDEFIAHALQEELSGPSDALEAHEEAYIHRQHWLDPTSGHCSTGHMSCEEDESHEIENSHSSSNPRAMSANGDEFLPILDIADEYTLDGESGKWLDEMTPVPHVPKINGEIPSVDEATSDHQILLNRLQLYELTEVKVKGDGNCQFRSLSDQIYRTPEHHDFVRGQVVNQLKFHPEMYDGYVTMAYGEYTDRMSKNGEWGDHVTLQAAADTYGVKVFVFTSYKDTCYIEILPQLEKTKKVIYLSFWAEVHYNSIYPQGDFPSNGEKKKKKWWNF